ncbi:hypothetical protein Q3G72_005598 [Acer saccharum]|nr:hypothetical protein Q3G72_005598 [Acer saccharum]
MIINLTRDSNEKQPAINSLDQQNTTLACRLNNRLNELLDEIKTAKASFWFGLSSVSTLILCLSLYDYDEDGDVFLGNRWASIRVIEVNDSSSSDLTKFIVRVIRENLAAVAAEEHDGELGGARRRSD